MESYLCHMCGIAGMYCNESRFNHLDIESTLQSLHHRGPDHQASLHVGKLQLLHTRLAIIDPASGSDQPMSDSTHRYHLSFNGEIYNYRSIRDELQNKGISFNTKGDTEVVLQQLIVNGIEGLNQLNGFFSFAFYDQQKDELIVARDRYGIKPLLYSYHSGKLVFASELAAINTMLTTNQLDHTSMRFFFNLNYIPAPNSIDRQVTKLLPGTYLKLTKGQLQKDTYYTSAPHQIKESYPHCTEKLQELITQSVVDRLVSDVPVGTFLSGGLDSSIVTMIAAQHQKGIESFSVGFKSNKYYDETKYAELIAKKANTNHHVILLEEDDLLHSLDDFIASIDEPFADSSAMAYFLLSKHTRKKVTVALSGDGADELFAGYNKYKALLKSMDNGLGNILLKGSSSILRFLPNSRKSTIGNKSRQVKKFAEGLNLSNYDRYWNWTGFTEEKYVAKILLNATDHHAINLLKNQYLLKKEGYNLNEILESDQNLVLANDMLFKADKMSMAHGLEVRVPFLDHRVVEFARSLPVSYKIDKGGGKKILRDAFKHLLPPEIYSRPKKGFEVPIETWFNGPLKEDVLGLLSRDTILEQGLFNPAEIDLIRKKIMDNRISADVHLIWALFIFQHYWKSNY